MSDSRNRARAHRFAHSVSAYLLAWGLNATVRSPRPHKPLSAVFAAEPDPADREVSTLVGLNTLSVSTRADIHLDLAGALNKAERSAGPGKLGVVVQHRKSPALMPESFVVMSLLSFAKIARIVERLDDHE